MAPPRRPCSTFCAKRSSRRRWRRWRSSLVSSVAILDIDGTLVDTNYHHAIAWYRAFRQHGIVLPIWKVHTHIGMGGDQLVASLTSEEVDESIGDEIRSAEKALYMALINEVEPMSEGRE